MRYIKNILKNRYLNFSAIFSTPGQLRCIDPKLQGDSLACKIQVGSYIECV